MIATITTNPSIDYNVQVDELVRNQTAPAKGSLTLPGGIGVNAARAITLLGDVPVTAYGFAGGHLGALLRSFLDEEKVAHDFIDTGLEIRINVLVTLTPDRALVPIETAGPDCTEEHGKELVKQLLAIDPPPKFVVIGGALPGSKLPAPLRKEFYARMMDQFKTKRPDVKFVVDSTQPELGHAVDKSPYLVNVNVEEMGRLAGRVELDSDESIVAAASALISKYGVGYFVVNRGAAGAVVVGKDERYRVSNTEAVEFNRVGSREAALGSLVSSLAKGEPIDEAVKMAVTVGTATVVSPATALFRMDEVTKLLPKTSVVRL